MRTCSTALLSCMSFILAADVSSTEVRVRVSAAEHDLQNTPVCLELDLSEPQQRLPATIEFEAKAGKDRARGKDFAQIEPREKGPARVWWIHHLPAGMSHEYTVRIGEKPPERGPAPAFTFKDSSGEHGKSRDLLCDGRPVLRYMYTPFDPQDIEKTKKPFHHVFDPDGSRPITKGAGGLFPHHRGIFFGYKKCEVDGASCDTWHAAHGEHQVHVRTLKEFTGPVFGGHEVRIHWNDRRGRTFIEETRRVVAFRQPKDELLIEFTSTLRTTGGTVKLSGDRQHAGVQFRAAQEVADNQKATRYLRPAEFADLPTDKQINSAEHVDLPWNAVQYKLGDRSYTVAYLSDPANPAGAVFSERLYGRFGEYFPCEVTADKPVTVRYRWFVTADKDPSREQIQHKYEDLAKPPAIEVLSSR